MNLEIYRNGSFTKIDPNKSPRTFKELNCFKKNDLLNTGSSSQLKVIKPLL